MSARLQDLQGTAVPGVPIDFALGGQTCTGVTNAAGVAACAISPSLAAGSYPLTVSFAGTSLLQPSRTSASFVVTREEAALAYSGDTNVAPGRTAPLAPSLPQYAQTALAGRAVG